MRKVLIVDDEEWTRISIKEIIGRKSLGMEVSGEARNGQAALGLIRQNPPDILITDIRMPIMDGMALLERVHQEFPKIIPIVLSGYSEFEYAKKAIVYGVFDYILKPIDEDQLDQTLNKAAVRLNEEDFRKDELVQMNIQINESGPLTKERALTRWVTDPRMTREQIRQALRKADFPEDRTGESRMVILVFQADNFEQIAARKYGNDAGLTSFVLLNALEELLQPLGSGIAFRKFGRQNEFIWLKTVPPEELDAEFHGFYGDLERVLAKLAELAGFSLHVGVGGEFADIQAAVHPMIRLPKRFATPASFIADRSFTRMKSVAATNILFIRTTRRKRCCTTWRTATSSKRRK
ncbi:response regulator [Cohnella endophytica]|uniref:Response regulator n=1 Tax=Cohnella endophytica TaxID=2419778 RepID=A0A494XLH3_9BACL|nr:response regulator [Cohnella endophytica]RKP51540.1 response regulator [Cohnella endophytica]